MNCARSLRVLGAAVAAISLLAACSSDPDDSVTTAASTPASTPGTSGTSGTSSITLLTYDSFQGDALTAALADFTSETGIDVTIARGGDTGTLISKAVLTAGNPEGDVLFGIDNTFLSTAVDGKVFTPYESTQSPELDPRLTALSPDHDVTPVDFGDVCINTDIGWFADHDLDPPTSLDDLLDPKYRDLLVVENPATSSPGLAFLLATVAKYGQDGWQKWWKDLRANGVQVEDSWDIAYGERFSGVAGSDGDRPLVVSYGSSPPAEVIYADPPVTEAPTGVIADTCFRQVEFAGVLRGTKHEAEAQQLVDFLAGERFQRELPLSLFVYPARVGVELPEEFTEYAVIPDAPLTVDPATVTANRADWLDEWTQIVLR